MVSEFLGLILPDSGMRGASEFWPKNIMISFLGGEKITE